MRCKKIGKTLRQTLAFLLSVAMIATSSFTAMPVLAAGDEPSDIIDETSDATTQDATTDESTPADFLGGGGTDSIIDPALNKEGTSEPSSDPAQSKAVFRSMRAIAEYTNSSEMDWINQEKKADTQFSFMQAGKADYEISENNNVTVPASTLTYSEWSQFMKSTDENLTKGYYLALEIEPDQGVTLDSSDAFVKIISSDSTADAITMKVANMDTVTDGNKKVFTAIIQVADAAGTSNRDDKKIKIDIDWDGEGGTEYATTSYTIDYNAVTFAKRTSKAAFGPMAALNEYSNLDAWVSTFSNYDGILVAGPYTDDSATAAGTEEKPITVTIPEGELQYTTWPEFMGQKDDDHTKGYYIALELTPGEGFDETFSDTVVTIKDSFDGSDIPMTAKNADTKGSDKVFTAIVRLGGNANEVNAKESINFEVDWDGAGNKYATTYYKLDLSKVKAAEGRDMTSGAVISTMGDAVSYVGLDQTWVVKNTESTLADMNSGKQITLEQGKGAGSSETNTIKVAPAEADGDVILNYVEWSQFMGKNDDNHTKGYYLALEFAPASGVIVDEGNAKDKVITLIKSNDGEDLDILRENKDNKGGSDVYTAIVKIADENGKNKRGNIIVKVDWDGDATKYAPTYYEIKLDNVKPGIIDDTTIGMAPSVDKRTENAQEGNLAEKYSAEAVKNVITVTPDNDAAPIPKHKNTTDMGYWAGVYFTAPRTAEGFKYAYVVDATTNPEDISWEPSTLEERIDGNDETKGATAYFDLAKDLDKEGKGYFALKWTGHGVESEAVIYEINFAAVKYGIQYTPSTSADKNIGVAPSVDQKKDSQYGENNLMADATATLKDTTIEVVLEGDKLPKHQKAVAEGATAANDDMGYWAGVYFVAPEGAKGFKYTTDPTKASKDWEVSNTLEKRIDGKDDATEGATIYVDLAKDLDSEGKCVFGLQWTDEKENESEAYVFTIDFSKVETGIYYDVTGNIGVAPSIDRGEDGKTTDGENLLTNPSISYNATAKTWSVSSENALKKHYNFDGAKASLGYWAGVYFEKPENATGFEYKIANTKEELSNMNWAKSPIEEHIEAKDGTKKGATAYFEIDKLAGSKGYFALKWTDDNGSESEDVIYTIDFSGVQTGFTYEPSLANIGLAPSVKRDSEGNATDDKTNLLDGANVDFDNNKLTVSVEGKALPKHYNGQGNAGYWAGAYFFAPEGAEGFKYAYVDSADVDETKITWSELYETDTVLENNENKGFAAYFDVRKSEGKKYIAIKWTDKDGKEETKPFVFTLDYTGVPTGIYYVPTEDNTGVAPSIANGDESKTDLMGTKNTDYTYTYNNGTMTITTISDKVLTQHKNGEGKDGYWAGVYFEAPADAKGFEYSLDGTNWKPSTLEEAIDGPDSPKKGATIYFDLEDLAKSKDNKGHFEIKWTNGETDPNKFDDSEAVKFDINFNVGLNLTSKVIFKPMSPLADYGQDMLNSWVGKNMKPLTRLENMILWPQGNYYATDEGDGKTDKTAIKVHVPEGRLLSSEWTNFMGKTESYYTNGYYFALEFAPDFDDLKKGMPDAATAQLVNAKNIKDSLNGNITTEPIDMTSSMADVINGQKVFTAIYQLISEEDRAALPEDRRGELPAGKTLKIVVDWDGAGVRFAPTFYEIIFDKVYLSNLEEVEEHVDECLVYWMVPDAEGVYDVAAITPAQVGCLINDCYYDDSITGWYTDQSYTKLWDFAKDIVNKENAGNDGKVYLYARVAEELDKDKNQIAESILDELASEGIYLEIEDIPNQTYSGKAIKPADVVVRKNGHVLKKGTDYTLSYPTKSTIKGKTAYKDANRDENGNLTGEIYYVAVKMKDVYYTDTTKNNKRTQVEFKVPFNVVPKDISGATVTTNGQIVAKETAKGSGVFEAKNALLKNVKDGKLALKVGTDYTFAITGVDKDGQNITPTNIGALMGGTKIAAIDKLKAGTYTITVTGKGNFTGEAEGTAIVQDPGKLMKNAKIILDDKSIELQRTNQPVFTGFRFKTGEKTPEYDIYYYHINEETNEGYIRAKGENYFKVTYTNNAKTGTATITVTPEAAAIEEGYLGEKTVTYKITASKKLKASAMRSNISKAIKGTTAFTFDGNAWNIYRIMDVIGTEGNLEKKFDVPEGCNLDMALPGMTYGEDYYITYKNNVNAGTATMTFKAMPGSAYSGSFNLTFKIQKVDLKKALTPVKDEDDVVIYRLAGENEYRLLHAEDVYDVYTLDQTKDEYDNDRTDFTKVGLVKGKRTVKFTTNTELFFNEQNGRALVEGVDYTISYKNNKEDNTQWDTKNKACTATITGKGSYAGSKVVIYFDPTTVSKENPN